MGRLKALAIFNALSFIALLVIAGITQSASYSFPGPWEVAEKYQTLLHPSSIVLGIWVVLYTSLVVHCLFHIIMAYKHDKTNPANNELSRMGILFILVNLAQAGWFLAWTNEQLLITVLIGFFQLACLIIIHMRLNIYQTNKAASVKVATQFPLSIYLGTTSMVTIITTAAYLNSTGWNGFGISNYQWALIMVCFVILLSAWMIFARRNIYVGIIAGWFLFAFIQTWDSLSNNNYDAVTTAAWAGIGIIFILSVVQLVRNLKYRKPREIFPSASIPLK